MKIITKRADLAAYINKLKEEGKSIGLVPTMGALHKGHLSLIEIAASQCDIIVCSIFVNPTQFNDPADLEKYPRPVEADKDKLKSAKCDILFMPDVQEMYPDKQKWHIDLGELENVLEARSRPGHYQGVTQIVKKLLDSVQPDSAFFGQKDYQQFLVISRMVEILDIAVKLVLCPIIRESDGLAMSSRNIYLSALEREQALALSEALELTKKNFAQKSIAQLIQEGITFLNSSGELKLDYFAICDAQTLQPASSKAGNIIVLVAAYAGTTRLIDNAILT